jgi:hypothetical protein
VDNTIFPVKMEVDYVRVYQTPEQLAPLTEGPGRVVPAQKGVPFSSKITDAQSYQWQVPDDATITTRADSIKLILTYTCGEYELGHPLWKPGTQYPYPDPYQPHVLPDTIDPTLFDFGGEKLPTTT